MLSNILTLSQKKKLKSKNQCHNNQPKSNQNNKLYNKMIRTIKRRKITNNNQTQLNKFPNQKYKSRNQLKFKPHQIKIKKEETRNNKQNQHQILKKNLHRLK